MFRENVARSGLDHDERQTLTVVETAARLGLSRNSTYLAIREGAIPHLKLGRRILVPRLALERLLEVGSLAERAPADGR